MGGEKKPLVMSELGCADGCGRAMGAEKCADGCGVGATATGGEKKPLVMRRAWLRGWLRTGNGCGEVHGRLRMARVQGSACKWVGRRSRW